MSGYLGPKKKSSSNDKPFSDFKDSRGSCFKLSPITKMYSYDQVVKYLNLRKNGICKHKAFGISQKVYCNLNTKENNCEKQNFEDDGQFDLIEKRFNEFATKFSIKDGEIVKKYNDFEYPDVKIKKGLVSDFVETQVLERNELKHKRTQSHSDRPAITAELLKEKNNKLKNFEKFEEFDELEKLEKFEKLEKLNKSDKLGKIEEFESLDKPKKRKKNIKSESSISLSSTEDFPTIKKPIKTHFSMTSLQPIRKLLNLDIVNKEKLSTLTKNGQTSRNISCSQELKPNNIQSIEEITVVEENSFEEKLDPITIKNKKLILKSLNLRKKNIDKILQKKQKKKEIESATEENLKKALQKKQQKLKILETLKEEKKEKIKKSKKLKN